MDQTNGPYSPHFFLAQCPARGCQQLQFLTLSQMPWQNGEGGSPCTECNGISFLTMLKERLPLTRAVPFSPDWEDGWMKNQRGLLVF